MNKILVIGLMVLLAGCANKDKEIYPYGMNEREWRELSIKDKATMRRDFYFYEKGSINFVKPNIEFESKKIHSSKDAVKVK